MASSRKAAALNSGLLVRQQAAAESHQAAAAGDLASTVEHVLSSRYADARATEQTVSKPQLVAQTVTSESLLAELAVAKASRPSEPRVSDAVTSSRRRSPLLGLFAFIGCAMILYGFLLKSPWHNQVPSMDRVMQLLN
jgi:hypothetical protein